MKHTRFLSVVLALLLVLSLVAVPGVRAAKEAQDFEGGRTVEFTFDGSDVENYANGGRSAVDLYLRRFAPQWLTYSLRGQGRNVVLTYFFEFDSYADYTGKLAALLTYQPGILYVPGQVLVEEFAAAQLLGSLQQGLGHSESLHSRAQVTRDILKLNGQEHDCTETGVKILPQTQPEVLLRSLVVTTTQKKNALERTLDILVRQSYIETDQWTQMVKRCERVGDVTQEEDGEFLKFSVTFRAGDQQSLIEMTDQCLDLPVSLSVQLTQATEEGCSYVRSESYLLEGYLEEGSYFHFDYACPDSMQDITVISPNSNLLVDSIETEDGEIETRNIKASNTPTIKFSYTAPFRFDTVSVQTDWPSALKKVQRTITLTAPTHAARVYHETIKKELSQAMPKGTVLEIYDRDQVRYYVLKYSAWFWGDIEEFTNAVLDTELTVSDSWLPMGTSTCTEDLAGTGVLKDFDPANKVLVSYHFPGTRESYTDIREPLEFEYQHLNIVKLAVLVLGLAALVIVILVLAKKLMKTMKNRPVKVKQPKPAKPAAQPAAPQFCGSCGTQLGPQDTFCPNCGSPRT